MMIDDTLHVPALLRFAVVVEMNPLPWNDMVQLSTIDG